MSKSSKKPRKKLDSKRIETSPAPKKKETDWSFDDIVRSKSRGR